MQPVHWHLTNYTLYARYVQTIFSSKIPRFVYMNSAAYRGFDFKPFGTVVMSLIIFLCLFSASFTFNQFDFDDKIRTNKATTTFHVHHEMQHITWPRLFFIFTTITLIQFNVGSCQLDLILQIIEDSKDAMSQPFDLVESAFRDRINRFQSDFSVSFITLVFHLYYWLVYGKSKKGNKR